MSTRRLLPVLGLLAAGLVVPAVASGQGNVQIGLIPSVIVFPVPGVPQYDAGWVHQGGVVVAVTSRPPNRSWELRVRAVEPELGQGKPVTDMLWRIEGSGAWTPLASTAVVVLQGMGDQNVPLEFRVLLDWASDGPGTYSVGIDFTIERL
jgi:hypothetical protein